MSDEEKSAIVIGASRGLGLGLVRELLRRGWHVIATYRSRETSAELLDMSRAHAAALRLEPLDINRPGQVADLAGRLHDVSAGLLFVNAGVSLGPDEKVHEVALDDFVSLLVTNAYSPMQVIEALDTRVRDDGVVAVMSSDLGSVGNNLSGGWEVYRASKASLNTLMKSRAAARADGRAYLCLSPGWVRTDMGGDAAPLDVATSVSGLIDTIEAHGGATGVHFLNHEGGRVAW